MNCVSLQENKIKLYKDTLCNFRAPALQLHGNDKLAEETSKMFLLFIASLEGCRPNQLQGTHLHDLAIVENHQPLNIFLHEIDIVDGETIGEFAR